MRQCLSQSVEVTLVSGAVGQRDIPGTAFFAGGIVVLAMHGEGEHLGICLAQGRGAVALVNVEVEDEKAPGETLRLQPPQRDH